MPDQETEQKITDAQGYLDKNDYPSAVTAYEQLLSNNPDAESTKQDLLKALQQWANQLATEENFDEAKKVLEKAEGLGIEDADLFVDLAIACKKLNQPEKAIEYYQKAIKVDNTYLYAYNDLGNLYFDKKEFDKAIEQYELALKHQPLYKYALYNLGSAYSSKGDVDKAIKYYEKAIQADPYYADPYNALGNLYLEKKANPAKAIEYYELALIYQPGFKYALYNLGRVYAIENAPDLAIENYQKAIDIDENYLDAYNGLGNVYYDINQLDKAVAQYEAALAYKPDYIYALYNLARTLNKKGDVDRALAYYQKAIQVDSSYADAYVGLGNIYLEKKENEKAIEHFQLALKYKPRDPFALYNLGRAYYLSNDSVLASEYYQDALKSDKSFVDSYNALGNIYMDNDEVDKALEQYQLALQYNPAFKYALYNIGRSYTRKGEPEKAIEFYKKAIEIDKSYLEAYNELGNLYVDTRQYDQAIEQFLRVLEIDPNYKYSLHNLGLTYGKIGELEKGKEYYQKALKVDNAYVAAYNGLGNLYLDSKDIDKAIEQYERALQHDPNFKYALFNLGVVYNKKGDVEKAIKYYEQTIKADSLYLPPYIELGYIFQRQYDYEKAHEQFVKTIELAGKLKDKSQLAEAHYNLGNLYLDKLDYEEARKQYEDALKTDPSFVFPQHNKAWIYEKLGQYKTAKSEWNKAKTFYSKAIANAPEDAKDPALITKYFYFAEILNYYIDETDPEYDPEVIQSYYKKAIELDNASISFRLSLLKFCIKRKNELKYKKYESHQEAQSQINEYHIQALHQYRTGVDLLQKRIKQQKDKSDLADLGEFYLVMEQYKEAATAFEEAIKMDDDFVRGHTGLGVAASKMENFTEAVKCFKKALSLDPDDLNIQSNLADAYLKSEKLALAEETYKKILTTAFCHMDAILGLAEHYKLVADKMAEKGKLNDSEEYLKQAMELYDDILKKNEDFSASSKKLNNDEISSVYYSIGYIKVKLYEINENLGFSPLNRFDRQSHLKAALKNFEKINEGQPDFYKAQTAIKKIEKQFKLDAHTSRKSAPFLIFILSLFICLTMQFFFWWGRPSRKEVFRVDKPSVESYLSKVAPNEVNGALELLRGEFATFKEVEDRLKQVFPSQDSVLTQIGANLIEKKTTIDFEPMDATPYALITFGSLIFMVVGLFLTDISKLKVGSIELEKTTSDTISTSPNLGIGR